jgi:hypothetical protein
VHPTLPPPRHHRIIDRFKAFVHALQRSDRFCDPVQVYRDELSLGIASTLENLKTRHAKQTNQLHWAENLFERQKVAEKKTLQEELAATKTRMAESEQQFLDLTTPGFEPEFDRMQADYHRWRDAVGRPPYSSRFDTLSDLAQRETTNVRHARGRRHWLIVIFEFFISIYPLAALPVDVIFTYAAFDVILQGSVVVTIAAAMLFTGGLTLLGDAIGVFWTRMRPSKLVGTKIEYGFSAQAVAIVVVLVLGAGLYSSVGASLRVLIPQFNALDKFEESLDEKLKALRVMAASIPDRVRIQADIDAIPDKKQKLLEKPVNFFATIDGQVAFAIYLTLALSAAIRRVVVHDPIFEYGVVAVEFIAAFSFRSSLGKRLREAVESDKAALPRLGKNMATLDETPELYPPLNETNGEIRAIKLTLADIETERVNYDRDATLYVESRARRYAKYYILCRFRLPKPALQMIEKHLPHGT